MIFQGGSRSYVTGPHNFENIGHVSLTGLTLDSPPIQNSWKNPGCHVIGTRISLCGLEKYLNIEDCLVKSLKIKSVLKSTGQSLKVLEFYYLL